VELEGGCGSTAGSFVRSGPIKSIGPGMNG
jgi:hypothetical protein